MSILNNAKEIADLIKKYNDQDLYERIVALREQILELREENLSLKEVVTRERFKHQQIVTQFYKADAQRQVLSERINSLGHRSSITRLMWVVLAGLLAYVIDSARLQDWANFAVFSVMGIVLTIAIYLVDRTPRARE